VRVLQDHSKITAVMKDGQLYRGLTRTQPYHATADDLPVPRSTAPAGGVLAEKVLTTVD
jgi:hypothetical protein